MKTATVNVRVDEKLKKDCEAIFDELGFGMSTAITMFLKAVRRTNGMPFNFEIPNEVTLEAFKEGDEILAGKKKAKRYTSIAELRKDLDK